MTPHPAPPRPSARRFALGLALGLPALCALGSACQGPEAVPAKPAAAAKEKGSEDPAPPKAVPEAPPKARPEDSPARTPSAAICHRALACSANCYAEVGSPTQSMPECADPSSEACTQALAHAKPTNLEQTLAAVSCVLTCEPEARTLKDLRGVDPTGWAALSSDEQGAWAGISAGRDCVPRAKCDAEVCDAEVFAPPAPVAKRGKNAGADTGAATVTGVTK